MAALTELPPSPSVLRPDWELSALVSERTNGRWHPVTLYSAQVCEGWGDSLVWRKVFRY